MQENSKVILVIDWSNLMFRSLYMHQLFGNATSSYEQMEDLKSFTNKFAIDVCSIINMFRPNNIIIATDSQHVWRKDIDEDYKDGRTKDPNINWENIYKCSDDLQAILSKHGMNVAKVDRAEADDIMTMVKEVVMDDYPNYNIIIVSADADIRQLISFNKDTHQYCVVYNTTGRGKNSKRRMYVTQEFKDWIEEPDKCDVFFQGYEPSKHYMTETLTNNPVIELFVENPNNVILGKIMCGDDGDNVKSFYGFYKNGRWVRITPSKSTKILELLGATDVHSLLESAPKMKEVFEKVCKKPIDDCDFNERLHHQRLMMELNSELFPKWIQQYTETIDYMIRNNSVNMFQNLRAQELLKGSSYAEYNKPKSIAADVFNDIEKRSGKTIKRTKSNEVPNINASSSDIINTLFDF